MANDALDLAFARHVRQIGLLTPEQVTSALQTQAKATQAGTPIPFAEALVQMGLITALQRESLEKKVKEQQAGVQQLGPYRLIKKLGEGGMGAVYLAQEQGRSVAIKVLPRHSGSNPEYVKRFKREAEAASALKHPNIVGAFSSGEDQGYHYYVMEFCDGLTLDGLLAAERTLSVPRAIDIILQASRGLKYAHDLGFIHRDIKPSNIFFTQDGVAKILDLGLSKNVDEAALSFKTVSGAVLGTPHYISPEQAQGEKGIDGRTDIYSLGATLYHLLTGRTPFDGTTVLEILSKQVNMQLPNPQDLREDIPDSVVQVLQRMMAKKPGDRYRDCGELILDLDEITAGRTPKTHLIADGLTLIAPPARRAVVRKRTTVRRVARSGGTNRTPLLLVGVAAVAAIAILLVVTNSREEPPQVAVRRPDPAPVAPKPPPAPPVEPAAKPVVHKHEQAAAPTPTNPAAWAKYIASLPAYSQAHAVLQRLKEVNPKFDGAGEPEVEGNAVVGLKFSGLGVTDLSPIRALPALRALEVTGRWDAVERREYRSPLTNLDPLRGTAIEVLRVHHSEVADLSPLKAMPLRVLDLCSTKVVSLSPVEGMRIAELDVSYTPLVDLSPLRTMALETLCVPTGDRVDLSPLRDLPVRHLHVEYQADRHRAILKAMGRLETVNGKPVAEFWRAFESAGAGTPDPGADAKLRAVLAKLKELNPEFDQKESHAAQDGAVTELTISGVGVRNIAPLAELTGLRKLGMGGRWDNAEAKEYRCPVSDLAPLRGLKLVHLEVSHSNVTSLEPLQGMPLESLDVWGTNVSDLGPLRKMPLKKLIMAYCDARSVAPLEGLPLEELDLHNTGVSDFTPLKSLIRLRVLTGSFEPRRDAGWISAIRTLQQVNGKPVAEFLKAASPAPADPAWKNAVDLLAAVDPARDAIKGTWRKENGALISEPEGNGCLRLPYEPPAEYDFRIVFTRVDGKCATAQFLAKDGRGLFFELGGYGNQTLGFSYVGGKGTNENATGSPFRLKNGVRYVLVTQVRRDRMTAFLDDKKVSEWTPAAGEISTDTNWCLDVPNLIGLGNCDTLTTFESVLVREISGKGRLRTGAPTSPDAAFLKSASSGSAETQLRRVLDKLKELNPGFDPGQVRSDIDSDRLVELGLPTARLTDLWPVRALGSLKKLDLSDENKGQLSDISCLKGMKLQELNLTNTRVVDLAPLQGMPLTRLQISGTGVKDLSAIKGLSLQRIDCERIPAVDFTALKSIRSLKTINDQPAADYFRIQKGSWRPIFDGGSLDCLRRKLAWRLDNGCIVNVPDASPDAAQTKADFENGEIRIRFDVKDLESLQFNIRQCDKGSYSLFFDSSRVKPLEGKTHELIFSCRGDQVTASLDGRSIPFYETKPVRSGCLQFNATGRILRISSIEYRELP